MTNYLAADRRSQARVSYHKVIDYALDSGIKGRLMKGITVDISETGLCLYLFTPLKAGQRILITSVMIGRYRKGQICWCRKIDEGVFKAGVMFC